MALFRSLIRAIATQQADVDPRTGELAYVNAGHDAPLRARAGGAIERLEPTGPALGLMPGQRFEIASTRIGPGELLLAVTDGVTDAGSAAAPFGEAGILARIAQRQGATDALLDDIVAGLGAIGGEHPDDVTLLGVQRLAG